MKKGNTRKPFQKIACLRSRFQKLTNKTNYFFMKRVLLILAVVFGCMTLKMSEVTPEGSGVESGWLYSTFLTPV